MGGLWGLKGVPQSGWTFLYMTDIREDGTPADETDYATCEMCGKDHIRYVHRMGHEKYHKDLDVGCICSERMSGDTVNPKRREATFRKRIGRRKTWLTRKWKVSKKGTSYLNVEGFNLGIFQGKFGKWNYWIKKIGGTDSDFGKVWYRDEGTAKLALFDALWELLESEGLV
jgi:hypothetical protein